MNGTGSNTWIIDINASDHMTYDANFFDELSSNTRDPYVTSANGLPFPITGEGTISLTPTMSLSRALLVPNIHCNLLSVGRLLDTLNASATFYPTNCSFQDLKTQETIGHVSKTNNKFGYGIVAWDTRRLATLSVCFRSCDESGFKCETCILAKSHCTAPARVTSNGFRWFVTFIDDCTRLTWVFLLENKHDVASILLEFCTMVSTQFHTRVRVFRTDNRGEYVNNTLASFFLAQGIIHQTTTLFTPQQNGVSERKNLSKLLLKVFGCIAYVNVYSHQRSKLDPCALRCVFIGYSSTHKCYKCYHPPTQKVHITLDVTFHEEVPYYVSHSSPIQRERGSELESLGLENDVFEDTAFRKETTCHTKASDRSPIYEDETYGALGVETSGHTKASDQSPVYENNDSDSCMDEFDAIPPLPCQCPNLLVIVNQVSVCVPTKLHDALSNSEWMDAMNVEIDTLNKNKTWDLVPLPRGKKAIGCRWVFTLKHKADGSIDRYKARLVAKGYTQTYRVDYLETFAPVAKLNTVHVLLSLATNHDWPLLQFDVKNAFLHGDLKEEIYMDLPPCHKGKLTTLIIYVDDMIVTGDDQAKMQNLQKYLAPEFEMKSLGDLKYFLGIEVARSKHGIFLSQRKYILDLLAETGMLDCKPIDTPSKQNHKLGLNPDQVPTDKKLSVVSQFMHSPSEDYMGAMMRILRYLKVTPRKGLMFCKYGHTDVEGYTDADWAGSVTDRRSTSRYFTFVGGNLVTWRSKKQKWCLGLVSRPSTVGWFKKPMDLYCDNKAAIAIEHNLVQHDRTKHVEVDRHFVKEKLDAEIISFPFISSEYQLAEVFTKAVSTTIKQS
ncbi:hypothetical protein Prudu_1477S000700 [Prunus dulcis]|uniref:Integrase catalytic domain-containing protein n=1 Tax=Prunus dulcis TaxID=3755 RepID=A0A5H2XRJ7_PRUDU|nr:hypothetical protein Prudu_1477S000700 [Prunus dulcis]